MRDWLGWMSWLLAILLVVIPVFALPLLIAAAVLSLLTHNLVFVACWVVLVSAYLAFWLVAGIRDAVRWPGRTVEITIRDWAMAVAPGSITAGRREERLLRRAENLTRPSASG